MIVATRRKWARLGRGALLAAGLFFAGLLPAFGQASFLADLDANLARLSAPVAISTATTTLLIAAPTGKTPGGATQSIRVTGLLLVWGGTGKIQLITGTQTTNPCDTGAANVTGNMDGISGQVIAHGTGFGALFTVPPTSAGPGQQLCAVTTQAIGINGLLSYGVW